MKKDLSKLYGKPPWVWYVKECGGVDGIIATCKLLGARGVIVKCADGTTPWQQFAESIAALKGAGLVVGSWAYVYPADPRAQAETIMNASQGADYLIVDAESEFEAPNMDTAAQEWGHALRTLAPDMPIGLTTFALPRFHRAFPYLAFSRWVDFLAPQVYWADAGMDPRAMLDQSLQGLAGYGLEVLPVGQAYPQATPEDIALFAADCVERGVRGISWWSVQHMTPEIRAAVADTQVYVPPEPKHAETPVAHGLDAKQAATIAEIEKLAEELKHE